MIDRPRFICLTPCCNEGWVIGTHLQGASEWADAVIVGDQMSTDDTREVVQRFSPKAMLVDNTARGYHEGERHRIVFNAARKLYPDDKKILMAIDSDELLSANWRTSPEWKAIQELPPGSGIYAEWANINPDFKTWFPLGGHVIVGVVDDGKIEHSPGQFHVPRLVQDPSKPKLFLNDIRLLHLQYTDPQRSASKNRAYQVQEWITSPKRPIRLFRRFNSTQKINPSEIQPLAPEWIQDFERNRIGWNQIRIDGMYRWDRLVLDAILKHGESFFRRLAIWDVDWNELAKTHGLELGSRTIRDPRSKFEKLVHQFLVATQPYMGRSWVRLIQAGLRANGW